MKITPTDAVEDIRRDILERSIALGCKPEEYKAWHIADLIARQDAQINRMRSALLSARDSLATTLSETERCRDLLAGSPLVETDEAAAVIEEYRAALRMIDEAIGDDDDR